MVQWRRKREKEKLIGKTKTHRDYDMVHRTRRAKLIAKEIHREWGREKYTPALNPGSSC